MGKIWNTVQRKDGRPVVPSDSWERWVLPFIPLKSSFIFPLRKGDSMHHGATGRQTDMFKTGNAVPRERDQDRQRKVDMQCLGGAGHFSIFVLLPAAALFFSFTRPALHSSGGLPCSLSLPYHRGSAYDANLSCLSSIVSVLLPESANSDTLSVRSSQLVPFCHCSQQILSFKKNQSHICIEF